MLGKVEDSCLYKNKTYHTDKITQNKVINVRPETITLEENFGGKVLELGLGDDFLDLTAK